LLKVFSNNNTTTKSRDMFPAYGMVCDCLVRSMYIRWKTNVRTVPKVKYTRKGKKENNGIIESKNKISPQLKNPFQMAVICCCFKLIYKVRKSKLNRINIPFH
jgi:hypothetical protein